MLLDGPLGRLSAVAGVPVPEIKMVSTFLLSYPLSSLFTRLPPSRPNIAHAYSIAIAAFYLGPWLGFGAAVGHLLVDCAVVYGAVMFGRGARMPWFVFGFVMSHLLYLHAHRTIYGLPEGQADITFPMMMMVQKLTMFAWNVHDGRRKAEDLDASQLATRLLHVPSPLAFLGYCFFFPSMLAGPTFDYTTYDALVLHKLYDQSPPSPPSPSSPSAQSRTSKRRIPYGRKRVAYLHLTLGLGFMALYALYGSRGAYARILAPEWDAWGWATRLGFIQVAGLVARIKYYGVWSLTEGACILTGVGFNGYDPKTGRTLWNRVRNINIISIESAESFKVLFDSWNCRTNIWLRDCVYKRLVKKGQKPGGKQSMATFLTSAVWHGVEPGYYLAFLTAGLLTSLGRQCRNYIRPYFLASAPTSTTAQSDANSAASPTAPNSLPKYPYPNKFKRLYDVVGWAAVQVNLNYIASSFILLKFSDCVRAYARMGWYTHAVVVLGIAFFQLGGRRALRKGLPARPPRSASADKKVGAAAALAAAQVQGTEPEQDKEIAPPQPKDERDPQDFQWVRHALEEHVAAGVEGGREGAGRDGMGGMVDSVFRGAETPGFERGSPGWSREGSVDLKRE